MLVSLFFVAITWLSAQAADGPSVRPGEDGVTLGVGLGWLWTDPSENIDSTWTVVPRLGYGLTQRWTIETDLGFAQGATRTWGYGFDAATPRLNVLFNLAPRASFEPFVVAGAGVIWKHVRRDPDTWELTAPEGENLGNYQNPDIDFLPNVGYGAFVKLGGGMALRVDFRSVLNVGTEPHGDIQDSFADWELTAGFAYRGAQRRWDIDGDGIVDSLDSCPEDPEDYDRFQDRDGCPDVDNDDDSIVDDDDDCPDDPEDFDGWRDADGCPEDDNDGDGLVDWKDECRDRAEDFDGYRDTDGCPDPDNDGDGITDLVDRCPNDPEDFDSFYDQDGCLDPDNDRDGLLDTQDACPDQPESWNGFEDDDGCPDQQPVLPPEIERFTGVIHGVNFELASADITVGSYRVLDDAASVLSNFPLIRIEVQGHTDSDGSERYNLDLSARRAQSVVDYLVHRGVGTDRLEWIGYGESRPLVSNRSRGSKAVNRRVEFHIVEDGTAAAIQ